MGTRSLIGNVESTGACKYVYCHWDGYPTHNGDILNRHYTSESKVSELLSLGDMSKLGVDIGVQHPFDSPYKYGTPEREEYDRMYESMCLFYGRDRGEKGIDARTVFSMREFVDHAKDSDAEYAYIFANGEWYGADLCKEQIEFMPVAELIRKYKTR
jgi:hypothetical protein